MSKNIAKYSSSILPFFSLPSMDPIMLYAISLHKYANDMTEMIKVADVVAETNLIPPAAPPMPSPPEINFRKNTLNYAPKRLMFVKDL